MRLVDDGGVEVETGAILRDQRGRYVLVGHDQFWLLIETMDGRKVREYAKPSRFELQWEVV